MIENPGETPDFAIFARLNKRACMLSTSQYVEAAVRSKWKASGGVHCSHWRGH